MEESTRKELEELRRMVLAWKKSYLESIPPDGGGDFLVQEFTEEIETNLYPYLRRLLECDYLTQVEANELLEFCYNEVEALRSSLRQAET
jgi:hypothetical protein